MKEELDSPILDLKNNIIWAFENATPYAGTTLSEAIRKNKISDKIILDFDYKKAPPRGPRLCQPNHILPPEMCIGVKHLELLWSFTYGWMIIYEQGVQLPLLEKRYNGTFESSDPLICRACQLLEWSMSLRTQCTAWPPELPSPRHYATQNERTFGEKVNLVFQQAAAFLLGHEFAHATGDHLNYAHRNTPNISAIEAEQDADVAAFSSLIEATYDDSEKLSQAWAILVAVLSSMHIGENLKTAFVQRRHPPLHIRLSNFMQMLDFKEEKYRSYFPMLATLILEHSLPELESVPRCAEMYDDSEEAFQDVLDRVEKLISAL